MNGTKLFLISSATLLVLSSGFLSCEGNVKINENKNQNQSIEKSIIQSKDVMVVKTGSRLSGSVIEIYTKNISGRTLNGTLVIKINYNDGSSHHQETPVDNFYPEEVRKVVFPIYLDRGGFNSYSFVNK